MRGGNSLEIMIFFPSRLSSAHLILSKLGENWSLGTKFHPYQISSFLFSAEPFALLHNNVRFFFLLKVEQKRKKGLGQSDEEKKIDFFFISISSSAQTLK